MRYPDPREYLYSQAIDRKTRKKGDLYNIPIYTKKGIDFIFAGKIDIFLTVNFFSYGNSFNNYCLFRLNIEFLLRDVHYKLLVVEYFFSRFGIELVARYWLIKS